jgi:hypothetical protein
MYLNPNTNEQFPDPYREFLITGNTENTITVSEGSDMTPFADAGDYYWIRDPENPAVDIMRLRGYQWSAYEAMTVDDGGNAATPSEITIGLY